jgi:hypothetical protein
LRQTLRFSILFVKEKPFGFYLISFCFQSGSTGNLVSILCGVSLNFWLAGQLACGVGKVFKWGSSYLKAVKAALISSTCLVKSSHVPKNHLDGFSNTKSQTSQHFGGPLNSNLFGIEYHSFYILNSAIHISTFLTSTYSFLSRCLIHYLSTSPILFSSFSVTRKSSTLLPNFRAFNHF